MNLVMVEPTHLVNVWSDLGPRVRKILAESGGRIGEADTVKAIVDGQVQLFVAARNDGDLAGIVLTRLMPYGGGLRAFDVIGIEGDKLEEMTTVHTQLEAIGKALGCHKMECWAVPGTERVMKPHGWAKRYVLLEKDLSDG